jgi:pectate lyase
MDCRGFHPFGACDGNNFTSKNIGEQPAGLYPPLMAHVKDFGAVGDGKTDDTAELQHAINDGERLIVIPAGTYRITKPLVVDLDKIGFTGISGDGGTATIVMDGPGPALRLVGTHGGTADPNSVKPNVWQNQRMPTVSGIEIVGNHPEAIGIQLERTMQTTLTGVLIRKCKIGIHLITRNRNPIISNCHIYDGAGKGAIGIYLDGCDLHQINIIGCHISYHRHAGIKLQRSSVRNLQITGCDIEYNFDAEENDCADVLIDARAAEVREVTIASCTIQAKYSPTGANIRIEAAPTAQSTEAGLWTICGNIITNQTHNLLLRNCRGVTVTGNTFGTAAARTILIERCRNLVIGSNNLDFNPDYKGPRIDGVLVKDSAGINLHGLIIESSQAGTARADGAIGIFNSSDITVANCQILNPKHRALHLDNVHHAVISANLVRDHGRTPTMQEAVLVTGGSDLEFTGNLLDKGKRGEMTKAQ